MLCTQFSPIIIRYPGTEYYWNLYQEIQLTSKNFKKTEETCTQFPAIFATSTNHKQNQFKAKIHLLRCWKYLKYSKTNKKKTTPQHIWLIFSEALVLKHCVDL